MWIPLLTPALVHIIWTTPQNSLYDSLYAHNSVYHRRITISTTPFVNIMRMYVYKLLAETSFSHEL